MSVVSIEIPDEFYDLVYSLSGLAGDQELAVGRNELGFNEELASWQIAFFFSLMGTNPKWLDGILSCYLYFRTFEESIRFKNGLVILIHCLENYLVDEYYSPELVYFFTSFQQ